MSTSPGTVIILLDQSIGELRRDDQQIIGIDLWPTTEHQLSRLQEKGHALTLVIPSSMTAPELDTIRKSLPDLTVMAGPSLATLLDGLSLKEKPAVFVSIDRQSRTIAFQKAKLETAPHLNAAEWVLSGERLSFAKILSRRRPDIKNVGLLPYYMEKRDDEWLTLGLITDAALLRMIQASAVVDLLPFDYRLGTCALLRLDDLKEISVAQWEGGIFLAADQNRLLLAFYDHEPSGAVALASGHGAWEALLPSPELLSFAEQPGSYTRWAVGLASALSRSLPDLLQPEPIPAFPDQLFLALPDAATFQADADRYSGQAPLGASGPIVSRHILHSHNLLAVNALVSDLTALGYYAYTHSFLNNGQTLYNVIAEMPGKGYLRISPEILKKLLKILRQPWPWPKIEKEVKVVLGAEAMKELSRSPGGPLRAKIEGLVGMYRWSPWRKFKDYYIGVGAQIVIVGCHLDSSGSYTPGGYNPTVDPAPGMDDNASGIAACLATARYLSAYKGQLIHTVRFCFFNAEEVGLVGSKAYAASLKALNAPVRAAVCIDMIGYNSDANHIFEIHAGYSDPAIRDLSLPVASVVETWASSLGTLQPAQIYKGTSTSVGAPDRTLFDPAINRSDHGAFHQQGYPAVAVTEDFFANLPTEPGKDPNPNYHTPNDKVIDANYGVSIASAVACAVKELADS